MKLKKILKISASLVCETGLHIGGGDTEMHIGGVDSQVVKNPLTNEPYIPGSSIKGKIRSLMELSSGCIRNEPFGIEELKNAGDQRGRVLTVLQLFGVHGDRKNLKKEQEEEIGQTRLSFWDCPLSEEWKRKADANDFPIVEEKSENGLNRINCVANPRQIERVVAGAEFDFTLTVKILDSDNEDEIIRSVYRGLKLLELDSLGGSGSRGYGKVSFKGLKQPEGYGGNVKFEEVKAFGE